MKVWTVKVNARWWVNPASCCTADCNVRSKRRLSAVSPAGPAPVLRAFTRETPVEMGYQVPGGSPGLKISKLCWMCDTWCLAGPVIRVKLTGC